MIIYIYTYVILYIYMHGIYIYIYIYIYYIAHIVYIYIIRIIYHRLANNYLLSIAYLHVFIYIYITYNASVFPHCPVSFTRVAYCVFQPLPFPHASTASLAYDTEAFFRSSPYSLMVASVDQPDTMHAKQVIVFLLPIG